MNNITIVWKKDLTTSRQSIHKTVEENKDHKVLFSEILEEGKNFEWERKEDFIINKTTNQMFFISTYKTHELSLKKIKLEKEDPDYCSFCKTKIKRCADCRVYMDVELQRCDAHKKRGPKCPTEKRFCDYCVDRQDPPPPVFSLPQKSVSTPFTFGNPKEGNYCKETAGGFSF